jgi:hypothetical protein
MKSPGYPVVPVQKAPRGHVEPKKRVTLKLGKDRIVRNLGKLNRRILIGTPTLGVIRMEWDSHRRGQIIPINFQIGEIQANHQPDSVIAEGYHTADAQNVIVERAVLDRYEWLLLLEDDVLMPFDTLLKFNQHMIDQTAPIVSGLYFSKSEPSWPLVFRGRGNGAYLGFNTGDRVWCDGVPTGLLLLHGSILQYMWHASSEYKLPDGRKCRRVFEFHRESFYDPEEDRYFAKMGTCLTPDTEVMTADGFKLITSITSADRVVGLNPETGQAEYVEECKQAVTQHEGPLVHVHGQTIDLLSNAQHRMWCAFRRGRKATLSPFGPVYAGDLLGKDPGMVAFSADLNMKGDGSTVFEIPKVPHAIRGRKNRDATVFPIIPFAAFMGWYFSEGCTAILDRVRADGSVRESPQHRIHVAKVDGRTQQRIGKIVQTLGFAPQFSKTRVTFSAYSLSLWLKQFGYAHEKFIPRELLDAPRPALLAMLKALVAADGQIVTGRKPKSGIRYEYHTVSKRLADDVQELALRCGYRAQITRRKDRPAGYVSYIQGKPVVSKHSLYIVRIAKRRFISAREFDLTSTYSGPLYSLVMPRYHVYMVRRHGKCVWTMNSDLYFCDRLIKEKVFAKTGWKKFAKMRYPFLCDTSISAQQIDLQGKYFPAGCTDVLWPARGKTHG